MTITLGLQVKKDFEIFNNVKVNNCDLVYLDNAATTQKPKVVVDAISSYYLNSNANVKRGLHFLADASSNLLENSRQNVAKFLGAAKASEIIFTKNSTEALNMVAFGLGYKTLKKGDVVLMSAFEHNSNLLPWQKVCNQVGAKIEFFDFDNDIDLKDFKNKLNANVKFVVFTHVSNVMGWVLPAKQICKLAKQIGAVTIIDASQSVGHIPVNVKSIECDFLAFSAHKVLGPQGIGVLYGKYDLLNTVDPLFYGGGMIKALENEGSNESSIELLPLPERLEAGTPDVAGIVGLSAALNYINTLGLDNIQKHEEFITNYALQKLNDLTGITILGPNVNINRGALISFMVQGVHSHDISAVLNTYGVAVRSGVHCAMHLSKFKNIMPSTRISFSIYNTTNDIDVFINALQKALQILK